MSKQAPSKSQSSSKASPSISAKELQQLQELIVGLKEELETAQDKEQRALADYQNLIRRTQEERGRLVKLATLELVESLLLPLEHLNLALTQTEDTGLQLVAGELLQALHENGLEELDVMGKEFDVEQMEVVERSGKGQKVTGVAKPGYRLNGEIIQHAKVVVG
jgi:molecular chaperone GrpE